MDQFFEYFGEVVLQRTRTFLLKQMYNLCTCITKIVIIIFK